MHSPFNPLALRRQRYGPSGQAPVLSKFPEFCKKFVICTQAAADGLITGMLFGKTAGQMPIRAPLRYWRNGTTLLSAYLLLIVDPVSPDGAVGGTMA